MPAPVDGYGARTVTSRRYLSYCRALRWIDELDLGLAGGDSIGLLRELAEDLLLSRGPSADAEELNRGARAVLRTLTEQGAVTRSRASEIRFALRAAGPERLPAAEPAALVTSRS